MTVPYSFTGNVIPISRLNTNFAAVNAGVNTANTVNASAQPAITSVGTLTSLSVTGNVRAGSVYTNNYYYANGTPFAGGGGGAQGTTGTQGIQGVQGPGVGAQGSTGAQGFNGTVGSQGTTGAQGATGAFTGNLTANINGQGYNISNVSFISATGNVYSGGNIAVVSSEVRNIWVANTAPSAGQGAVGDIWYQTF